MPSEATWGSIRLRMAAGDDERGWRVLQNEISKANMIKLIQSNVNALNWQKYKVIRESAGREMQQLSYPFPWSSKVHPVGFRAKTLSYRLFRGLRYSESDLLLSKCIGRTWRRASKLLRVSIRFNSSSSRQLRTRNLSSRTNTRMFKALAMAWQEEWKGHNVKIARW